MKADPGRRLAEARRALLAEAGVAEEAQLEALERLTRVAVQAVHAQAAFVSLVGDQEALFRSSTGLKPPFGGKVEPERSVLRRIFEARAPIALADVRDDATLREAWEVSLLGAVALLAVPLFVAGIPLGALAVLDPAPRPWSTGDQRALEDLALVATQQIALSREARAAAAREAERAERALLASEARFRTLVEHVPDGIYVVQDDRVAYANPAGLLLAGATAKAIVGMPAERLIAPPYLKSVRARVLDGLPPEPRPVEDTLARLDGVPIDVEISALPYLFGGRPAVLLLARDIRERKRADQEIRGREAQLRLLVEQLPVLVWSTDAAQRVKSTHGGRGSLAPTPDPIGAPLSELFGSRDPAGAPLAAQARAAAGTSAAYRIEWQRRTWDVHVEPLHAPDGAVVGTVGAAMDVSPQLRAAEQLRATEHLASLGQLAAGVAHEMNNVFAAILATSEAIDRMERAPTRAELDVLEGAARRGAEITSGLLGFARKGMYRRVRVGIAEMLDRLAGRARSAHPRVRVERTCSGGLPSVEGEPEQIETALWNLCENALEAMPEGGTLSIGARADLGADRPELDPGRGPWVRVEVRDTGVGMIEEVRRRAVEPFFTTRAPGQGVGLGLSMAYGVIRNHGGQLLLESEPGRGTTVTVYLPAAPAAAAALGPPPPARGAAVPAPRGGVVLVVDDDEWVRFSTGRLLRALGFEVIEAPGGPEGLAAYRARGPEIVAVLLDLRMPVLDGTEVLRRLVALDPDVRVILCTGYERDQVSQGLFGLGRVGFLGKPFGIAELEAQLQAFARPVGAPA